MTKKLLIVGAGGIGSWLAYFLDDLNSHDQINNLLISIIDDDVVDEKILPYQKFTLEDITDNKAENIGIRYDIEAINGRITKGDELRDYDLIVSCVDNSKFRKVMFHAAEKMDFYWIDLRSEGKTIAFYTKGKQNDLKKMLDTLPGDGDDKSCQLEYELEQGIIQQGNKIVAAIGSQLILNWLRDENLPGGDIRLYG